MKALVTGASSGIGRDIAKELSKKGYELILVARNKEKLEETQKELVTNSKIICMDLSNNESCIKLKELTGDVDVLVNNAGFGDFGSFEETDLNKELDMIKTNIMAMHILTKIYLKDMKKKDKGYFLTYILLPFLQHIPQINHIFLQALLYILYIFLWFCNHIF